MYNMLANLDIDQLKTFLAIAETGNFTRAADRVNKTQSAVSMQMKRLEDMINRALFLRDGRNSKLTEDGERFVEQARRIVATNDEIVSVYAQPALTGTLRFGTPDDYADLFLPELMSRFARSHPLVNIDVECVMSVHLAERVKRSELDLALVTMSGNELPGEKLREEPMLWVTSARHAIHLAPTLPLAVANAGCGWRALACDSLQRINRSYRVAYTSPNRSALDAAVLQGLAITIMPQICLRPGMRVLTKDEGFPALSGIGIGLISKPGKPSQAAAALAQHIRDSFGSEKVRVAA
jgi:DNA-binding transcriptional LysR family regulator